MPRLSSVVSCKLPFAPVYKKYMQKNKIKSRIATQKNPHWRGALFWRTRRIHSAIYCLCVNRNVLNCALLVLNYLLSNACASKSRIATQKKSPLTWGFILAHPARFERAVPAFGGRCSIQLSHGCKVYIL